jgi:hypothetical protein
VSNARDVVIQQYKKFFRGHVVANHTDDVAQLFIDQVEHEGVELDELGQDDLTEIRRQLKAYVVEQAGEIVEDLIRTIVLNVDPLHSPVQSLQMC